MAFQTSNPAAYVAPGIEGDFYGDNPLFTLTNPDEAQWNVGASGAYIGRFAWANTATGLATNAHPGVSTVRVGFVHRNQTTYITGLLLSTSLALTQGQPIDMLASGPVWCRFAAGATIGQKVYASYADGTARSAATGSPATATGVTWSQNNSTTVTSVAGGTLYPGQPVSGTGIPAGAYVVSVNTAAATAVLSAATTGGAATGVAITQTLDFETDWVVRSACLSGEVAKISVQG